MDPKQRNVLTIIVIIFVIASYFPLKNYLERRAVLKSTQIILKYWQTNNLTATYVYWKDPYRAPPIYGLDAYKIIKTTIQKTGGIEIADVYIFLDFPPDNLMPSEKIWILEFYKFPRLGWLVADFRQANP
jgi:hypothetical protein